MVENNWASGTLKEVPFWRDDMQPEEYDKEREYLANHWEEFTKGKYIPLWKQSKT
ncbi:MAG: hypothetical protein ACI4U6_04910 [Acutalibacteraceae bacterium]